MKNKIFALLFASALVFTACGSNSGSADSTTSSVAVSSEEEEVSSVVEEVVESIPDDFTFDAVPSSEETTETVSTYDEFVTLAEYKGLEVTAGEGAVTEEGHIVNIDYTGTIDGVAFDGGTAQGYNLTLGSGSFIDGFEDQLIGHQKGDVVDVVVTFPEDYGVEELNGKIAHFETTINEIYLQTIDEALVGVIDDSEIHTLPKDVVEGWTDFFKSYYQDYADAEGQTVDAYMASIGVTQDQLDSNVTTYSETEVVCRAILAAEGITEDSEEYTIAKLSLSTDYGTMSADDAITMGYDEKVVDFMILYQATCNVITENAAS